MAKNLSSDLRDAIAKISEVGRLLTPLISRTIFEELSALNNVGEQVDRQMVNSDSIAPSSNINNKLHRLFPVLKRINAQANPSSSCSLPHVTARGRK